MNKFFEEINQCCLITKKNQNYGYLFDYILNGLNKNNINNNITNIDDLKKFIDKLNIVIVNVLNNKNINDDLCIFELNCLKFEAMLYFLNNSMKQYELYEFINIIYKEKMYSLLISLYDKNLFNDSKLQKINDNLYLMKNNEIIFNSDKSHINHDTLCKIKTDANIIFVHLKDKDDKNIDNLTMAGEIKSNVCVCAIIDDVHFLFFKCNGELKFLYYYSEKSMFYSKIFFYVRNKYVHNNIKFNLYIPCLYEIDCNYEYNITSIIKCNNVNISNHISNHKKIYLSNLQIINNLYLPYLDNIEITFYKSVVTNIETLNTNNNNDNIDVNGQKWTILNANYDANVSFQNIDIHIQSNLIINTYGKFFNKNISNEDIINHRVKTNNVTIHAQKNNKIITKSDIMYNLSEIKIDEFENNLFYKDVEINDTYKTIHFFFNCYTDGIGDFAWMLWFNNYFNKHYKNENLKIEYIVYFNNMSGYEKKYCDFFDMILDNYNKNNNVNYSDMYNVFFTLSSEYFFESIENFISLDTNREKIKNEIFYKNLNYLYKNGLTNFSITDDKHMFDIKKYSYLNNHKDENIELYFMNDVKTNKITDLFIFGAHINCLSLLKILYDNLKIKILPFGEMGFCNGSFSSGIGDSYLGIISDNYNNNNNNNELLQQKKYYMAYIKETKNFMLYINLIIYKESKENNELKVIEIKINIGVKKKIVEILLSNENIEKNNFVLRDDNNISFIYYNYNINLVFYEILAPTEFKKLVKKSDIFVMMTGDLSTQEALTNKKIVLLDDISHKSQFKIDYYKFLFNSIDNVPDDLIENNYKKLFNDIYNKNNDKKKSKYEIKYEIIKSKYNYNLNLQKIIDIYNDNYEIIIEKINNYILYIHNKKCITLHGENNILN